MDTKTKSKFSTYSIVMMALFAAILCVSAYISIPLPNGTHITLLNFVITLIALVFPLAESFFIGLIWMLLGLVGVPVFVGGQAGPGYLFGTYGGFSFAFIFRINPMYYIVTGYRDAIYGHVWFWERGWYTLYFWGWTVFLLLIGTAVFRKLRVHFADVL